MSDVSTASATTVRPPPPPPPPENKAAQADATSAIEQKLQGSGLFHTISHGDIQTAADRLSQLKGPDACKVIDKLDQDGKLDTFTAKAVDKGGVFSSPGLSKDDQRNLLTGLAGSCGGDQLAKVQHSYAKAGDEHSQEAADAVATHASPQAKAEFVQAAAKRATATPQMHSSVFPPVNTTTFANADAHAAATVLSSTRGAYAAEGFNSLSGDQRQAVFNAAADVKTTLLSTDDYGRGSYQGSLNAKGFDGLMTAAGSITDPTARAAAVGAAADAVKKMGDIDGMGQKDLAPLASSALRALDGPSLAAMTPDRTASLAGTAAKGEPAALAATADHLSALPPSQARDATARTLFLKTDSAAYDGQPALARSMGAALAKTETADPARAAPLGDAYAKMLGTKEGRAFLADPNVDPSSRLWAANQVAADPQGAAKMIAGQDTPWESPAVAQAFARPAVDRMAAARGNEATPLKGGSDIDNFIGASIGAPITAKPQTEADAAGQRALAADGRFNYYSGTPAVQKAADGIRTAQSQMGGGDIKVSTVPVSFSSQQDGAFNLNLYKVEGANGQSRYVDNLGRTYKDFNDWKGSNGLPPGKMTYPADGRLAALGQTKLETADTPKAKSAGWDHFTRGAALVGAAAVGGLVILGTDGVGTPAAAGLWTLAAGSAAVTGAQAVGVLQDRAAHGQTLSLSDPEARAAWLSLGGSALTVGGAGVGRLATLAGQDSGMAAALARASGVLNTGANVADTAATLNSANDLVQNWNRMSPGQRTEAGLQLAFWGGMRGLSTRSAGQGLDGYSFRQQMNHALLDTGAAVKPNAELGAHDASIVPTRNASGAITDIQVQHGTDASKAVVDVHTAAARDLLRAAGPDGALGRAATGQGFKPGSYGEQVSFEAAKHQALIDHYDQALKDPKLSSADRETLTTQRAGAAHDLAFYRAQQADIAAHPEVGQGPAAGDGAIDVKEKRTHWLDPGDTVPRAASATAAWDHLQTPLANKYPDAKPVAVGRDGVTLPDGSRVSNTGGDGRKGGINLYQFAAPQSKGGYGGQVFYDAKSGALVLAANMRTKTSPQSVQRVEAPYSRNAVGQWRADFSQYSKYRTAIDPGLPAARDGHFSAANQNLARDWKADPSIKARLHLSPGVAAAVEAGKPVSPSPYTWHHMDGDGHIELVDSAIHELFLHTGGFSEWGGASAPKAP